MVKYFSSVIIAVIIVSCGRPSPGTTPSSIENLANVYTELLVLNERYSLSKDSLSSQQYTSKYNEILEKRQYTKEKYTSDFEWAAQSPERFRQLCDRVTARLQEMRVRPDTLEKRGRS